jgi:hypothetical protein
VIRSTKIAIWVMGDTAIIGDIGVVIKEMESKVLGSISVLGILGNAICVRVF